MTSLGFSSLSNQKPPFIKGLPIYVFNVFLLILSCAPVDFVAMDNVHVVFFLVPLFYWVIHNPLMMPLWFIFIAGLFIDLSIDGVLGLHAFAFVFYYTILYRSRRIILSQPMIFQFFIFALTALAFEALRWGTLSLLFFRIWDFFPSMIAVTVNIVAFPFIVLVLKVLHRILSGHGRAK